MDEIRVSLLSFLPQHLRRKSAPRRHQLIIATTHHQRAASALHYIDGRVGFSPCSSVIATSSSPRVEISTQACLFFTFSVVAAMLDSLMGRDRNVCGKEKKGDSSFKDEEVCKFYLLDYCPHELFPNTRSDLGPCPREHRSDLKEAFEKDADHEYYKALYEQEFMRFLKKLVDQMESRIKRVQQRIDANNAATEVDKDTAEKIQTVNTQISELLKKQDEAGSKGEMEVAEKLNEEVALLQREVQRLKNPHADIATIRESQLRVCAVCGALQSAGDALCRYESHASGKQHRGFERIRASLAKLVETESTRETFLNKHPLHRGSSARDSYYGGSGNTESRRMRSSSSVGRATGGGDVDRRRKPVSGNSAGPHGRSGGSGGGSGSSAGHVREEIERGKGGDQDRESRMPRGRSDDNRRYGGDGGLPDREDRRQRRGYGDYDGRGVSGSNSGRDGRVGAYGGEGREDRGLRNTGSTRYGGHDDAYYTGQDYRGNGGGKGPWEQQRRGGGGEGGAGKRDYYRGDDYTSRGYGGLGGGGRREREGRGRSDRLGGHDGYVEPRGRGGEGAGGKYGGHDERGDRRYYYEGGNSGNNREGYDERRGRHYYDDGSSGTSTAHVQGGRDDARWTADRAGRSSRRGREEFEETAGEPCGRSREERRNSRESEGECGGRRRERDEEGAGEAREEPRSVKRRRGDTCGDGERRRSRPEADDDQEEDAIEGGHHSRYRRDHLYGGVQARRNENERNEYDEARGASCQSREKRGGEDQSGYGRHAGSNRRTEDEEKSQEEPAKNGTVFYAEDTDRRSKNSQERERGAKEFSIRTSSHDQEDIKGTHKGHDFNKNSSEEAHAIGRLPPAQFGDDADDLVKQTHGGNSGKNEGSGAETS